MYGITRDGQAPIINVDTVTDIEPAIRDWKPGIYDEDEIGPIRRPVITAPGVGAS